MIKDESRSDQSMPQSGESDSVKASQTGGGRKMSRNGTGVSGEWFVA